MCYDVCGFDMCRQEQCIVVCVFSNYLMFVCVIIPSWHCKGYNYIYTTCVDIIIYYYLE